MPSEGQSFGSRLKNSNKSFIINRYICSILLISSVSSSRSGDRYIVFLTIIPRAQVGSESIAHEAESQMSY